MAKTTSRKSAAKKTAPAEPKPPAEQAPSGDATKDNSAASEAIRRSLGIPTTVWQQRMRQAERMQEHAEIGKLRAELLACCEKVTIPGDSPGKAPVRLQAKRGTRGIYQALTRAIAEVSQKTKTTQKSKAAQKKS